MSSDSVANCRPDVTRGPDNDLTGTHAKCYNDRLINCRTCIVLEPIYGMCDIDPST
jgi:hypothetical protein